MKRPSRRRSPALTGLKPRTHSSEQSPIAAATEKPNARSPRRRPSFPHAVTRAAGPEREHDEGGRGQGRLVVDSTLHAGRRGRRKPRMEHACGASARPGYDPFARLGPCCHCFSPYPRRIVCLTEETTETLYLLGEDWRIVGISGFTVRPPRARREKPRVSAFTSAKIDRIVALKPDLVLGFSDLQADIAAQLVRRGHRGARLQPPQRGGDPPR